MTAWSYAIELDSAHSASAFPLASPLLRLSRAHAQVYFTHRRVVEERKVQKLCTQKKCKNRSCSTHTLRSPCTRALIVLADVARGAHPSAGMVQVLPGPPLDRLLDPPPTCACATASSPTGTARTPASPRSLRHPSGLTAACEVIVAVNLRSAWGNSPAAQWAANRGSNHNRPWVRGRGASPRPRQHRRCRGEGAAP